MTQRYLEDFRVGERFASHPRTVTEVHFALFAAITGDNHPLHYDATYAAKTIFGRPVAHGLLVASLTALGASELSYQMGDSVIAFLEQQSRFLRPVMVGDTLYPTFEVAEVIPKGERGILRLHTRITNQRGEVVLEGSHTYLMKRRTPRPRPRAW